MKSWKMCVTEGSAKHLVLGMTILGLALVMTPTSQAATIPGVGPGGGGSDQTCLDILVAAQAECLSYGCAMGGTGSCCGDLLASDCYSLAQSAYNGCEANGLSGYQTFGFGGLLGDCPFDDGLDGFAYVDLTTGTDMQICWRDSNSTPIFPPTSVESVDLYAATSTSFWAQWAADSTISTVEFDLVGSATPDPLPDSDTSNKFATCWGWSMTLNPSSFVANTGYQLFAVIRDSAIPADSLKVITTTMFVTNSPASSVGDSGLQNRPDIPAVSIIAAIPNPFNPAVVLSFETKQSADLTLEIYDVSGRLVRAFELGNLAPGQHRARWNGRDNAGKGVSSGLYFARVAGAAEQSRMEKIVLVR